MRFPTLLSGPSFTWRLGAAILLLAGSAMMPHSAAAQAQPSPPSSADPPATPLKIGIIGAGTMGGGIGKLWAAAGHEIFFSSRNPGELAELVATAGPNTRAGRPEEAAAFGDIILLAVPSGALPQVGGDFSHLMQGKVVIEIGNPRADRDGPQTQEWLDIGTGLASAHYFPGTRLVKAFNTLSAAMLAKGKNQAGERIGVPVAGDDPTAVQVAANLVRDAGFDPVIVGPLARAREFDRGTPVWVTGMSAAQVREALKLPPSCCRGQ